MARTNEIVILSGEGSRVTGEVNRLLAELPVSVNALTGVDLTKVTHTDWGDHWVQYISFWAEMQVNFSKLGDISFIECIWPLDKF